MLLAFEGSWRPLKKTNSDTANRLLPACSHSLANDEANRLGEGNLQSDKALHVGPRLCPSHRRQVIFVLVVFIHKAISQTAENVTGGRFL
jgi:hypothetical protein